MNYANHLICAIAFYPPLNFKTVKCNNIIRNMMSKSTEFFGIGRRKCMQSHYIANQRERILAQSKRYVYLKLVQVQCVSA